MLADEPPPPALVSVSFLLPETWDNYVRPGGGASLVAQRGKNPPAMRETWVRVLAWEDPLEEGKATHSSLLAWRIPWTVVHGLAKSRTRLSGLHFQVREGLVLWRLPGARRFVGSGGRCLLSRDKQDPRALVPTLEPREGGLPWWSSG